MTKTMDVQHHMYEGVWGFKHMAQSKYIIWMNSLLESWIKLLIWENQRTEPEMFRILDLKIIELNLLVNTKKTLLIEHSK